MFASAPSVSLRPLGPEDASVMAGWGDDDELCRAAAWSVGVPHADRALFFSRLIAAPPQDLIRLAVLHEGVLVGYFDLRGTGPEERELGFVIGDRALGLRLIWAEANEANVGSVTILAGLGMDETNVGDPHGLRRFSITDQAWQK